MAINRVALPGGKFVYDVFHCRHDYIGMVAPYHCRSAFGELSITVNGIPSEWFTLPDSRQFTASILVKIPRKLWQHDSWMVGFDQIKVSVSRLAGPSGRLAMTTLVRFDAPYLAEWIEFHQKLGFEHFYVYNHEQNPDITAVLRGFNGRLVTELSWTGAYNRESAWSEPFLTNQSHCYTQCPQMMHAALKYGDFWDWMGFFDADEFLCPMTTMSIGAILNRAEQNGFGEVPFIRTAALEIQGKWFGTSGHQKFPKGSVLDNYTYCERGHTCGTKCLIQPHAVSGTVIHYWDVQGQTGKVPDNLLRFNHYRSISPYKARVGARFDKDYTNEIIETRIQEVKAQ